MLDDLFDVSLLQKMGDEFHSDCNENYEQAFECIKEAELIAKNPVDQALYGHVYLEFIDMATRFAHFGRRNEIGAGIIDNLVGHYNRLNELKKIPADNNLELASLTSEVDGLYSSLLALIPHYETLQ